MNNLDEKSREIILYIMRNRHASIRELSEIINAPNDNHTLTKIRGVINRVSENVLGKEILVFEENKFDLLAGEKILFSWWLDEDFAKEKPSSFIDVFDSGDSIKIIADMKIDEENMHIIAKNNNVAIYSNSKLQEKIRLPHNVTGVIRKSYTNGILELVLEKGHL